MSPHLVVVGVVVVVVVVGNRRLMRAPIRGTLKYKV